MTCEKKITVPVGDVPFVGYIDIDLRDHGVPFPIDLKSSSKKINGDKLKEIRQHVHYPYALGCEEFLYLLVTTPKMQRDFAPVPLEEQLQWTPEVQWKKILTGPDEKARWEDEVEDTALRISLDHFPQRVQPLCSWCPFQKDCPAWK